MFALLSLPSPLHPAVVHFPIVLLLLGSIVALAAPFVRRWHLPVVTAVLFGLGAIGTVVAVQTGEKEGELVNETASIEAVLEQHEEWAERTQIAAIAIAVLALAATLTVRWPIAARGLSIATAVGAFAVTWCVVQTGHYGGQLVYRHGAGVNLAAAGANDTAAKVNSTRKHDDD